MTHPVKQQGILDTEALELWALAMVCESVQGQATTEEEHRAFMRIVSFIRDAKLEGFRNRPLVVTPDPDTEERAEYLAQIWSVIEGLPGVRKYPTTEHGAPLGGPSPYGFGDYP
jgi:hypothetical protein